MAVRNSECYRFGLFQLDANERELRRGDTVVTLPGKAFDLLLVLVRGAGRTVTKSELISALWPDAVVEESNLTQTVFLVRKALGEDTEDAGYIRTVPRHGYRFVSKVSVDGTVTAAQSRWRTPRWLLTMGIIVTIAGVAVGFTYLRQPRPVPLDLAAYRYRPFAYAQGREGSGKWSPDGKMIAFLEGPSLLRQGWVGPVSLGTARLMVQSSDGGSATQLADQVDNCCSDLAWSPDGSRVYFVRRSSIYSVSLAGGKPDLVLERATNFDLSPDGKVLAVWRTEIGAERKVRGSVWISSPPGAQPREYTSGAPSAGADVFPAYLRFSPNGKTLYVSTWGSASSVQSWLLPFPTDSGSPRRIFRNVQWYYPVEASWMPDGRRMVFAGSIAPMNKAVLWLADTRDETLTRLTDGSVEQREPAVSPDGRRVAFTRVDQDADIIELPLDGGAPRNLLATSSFEYSPAWSPKGGAFAYMTWRNGTEELWMRSSQGDWERPVATPKEFPGLIGLINPAVSPDGSRVVYWTVLRDADHPSPAVYVSPTAGGAPTWIAPGGAASWSPDGASLAFWWMKPTGESVLATLLLGSNEQPFEIPGSNCHTVPEWSPSGEWIGCGSGKDATLISPDGKVKRALPGLNVGWVGWSKDSRTLYGLHGESGSWSLLAADIRTGAIRTVADYSSQILPFSPYIEGLRLSRSPDGKSFAFGTLKSKWDLWTLEGFTK